MSSTDVSSEPLISTPTAFLASPLRCLMGPKTHHVQTHSYVLPPNWVLFPSQQAAPPSIHLGKAGTGSRAGNSNFLTVLRSPHPTHHQGWKCLNTFQCFQFLSSDLHHPFLGFWSSSIHCHPPLNPLTLLHIVARVTSKLLSRIP